MSVDRSILSYGTKIVESSYLIITSMVRNNWFNNFSLRIVFLLPEKIWPLIKESINRRFLCFYRPTRPRQAINTIIYFILFYILLFYSGHFVFFLFYILACLCACCLTIVFVQTWIDFPHRLDFTSLKLTFVVVVTWWPQFAAARLTLPSPDGRHNRHKTENHRHDTFGWNTPSSSSHRLESPSRTTPSAHRRRSVRPCRSPAACLQRKVSIHMNRWSLRSLICVDDGE